MLVRTSVNLWLAALMVFAGPAWTDTITRLDPEWAWRDTRTLTELVEVFDTWLDQNTDFHRTDARPQVEIISPSFAASIQGSPVSRFGRLRGLFDPGTSTIYLILPWDRNNPYDASVLLHELVHVRQFSRHYSCPGAQEEAAYRHQDDWLRERGLHAQVNWIAVILEAGCNRRDFHPD